ncbi:MAG: hypothetical protein CL917_09275 [Deltaproteobacteria bacterium]|nr:hypothetical protein [Deltaproteobacteria bacterium]
MRNLFKIALKLGSSPCGWRGLLGSSLAIWLLGPGIAVSDVWIWVDEAGITHFTDDADQVPDEEAQAELDWERLSGLWSDGLMGPVLEMPAEGSSRSEARVQRILHAAIQDLSKGEEARAQAALRSVLRMAPRQAEAHWYLASMDRQRGRYARAADHLRSFIEYADPSLETWRVLARQRLALLEDERALADSERPRGPLRLISTPTAHFEIRVDQDIEALSSDFVERVRADLEEARRVVADHMGVTPTEPLGVVFYGRAAYARAHAHRFSFRTVGFFDGQIHVAAPAHAESGLRPLLFHEYTHAVFREKTGGDRPYWLNEGLSLQVERLASGGSTLSRSERSLLRAQLETGRWIPLRDLVAGFSGRSDKEARIAYLQSVLVVDWLTSQLEPGEIAKILEGLGKGLSVDQSLELAMGQSSTDIEVHVQEQLRGQFPQLRATLPASSFIGETSQAP